MSTTKSSRRLSSKRLSIAPSASGAGGLADPVLNAAMVSQMYSKIIKLSAENKITTKNTWSLPLIDHMNQLFSAKDVSFQNASCALEASVSIYSNRVEDVWVTSFRVLQNLRRSGKRNDGEDGDAGTTTKKRSRKAGSTLETNPANITVKTFDMEFDVDPLFHRMSKAFDEGGARGMLLNNLSVQAGCSLAFDSVDVADVDTVEVAKDASAAGAIDGTDLAAKLESFLPAGGLDGLSLCPQLEALYATAEEFGDTSLSTSASASTADKPAAAKEVTFAASDDRAEFDDDYGIGGGVSDDDDGDYGAIEEEAPSFVNPELVKMMAAAGHKSFAHWMPRNPEDSVEEEAAGDVLKVEGDALPPAAGAGEAPAPKKRAARKAKKKVEDNDGSDGENGGDDGAFFLDFGAPVPDGSEFKPPPRSATATQMTAAAMRKAVKAGPAAHLMAADKQVSGDELKLLEAVQPVMNGGQGEEPLGAPVEDDSSDEEDGGILEYNDDWEMPEPRGEDTLGPLPSFGAPSRSTPAGEEQSVLFEDNDFEMTGMVKAARKVEHVDVKYARVSKRVDVRKLKTDIWDYLAEQPLEGEEATPDPENPPTKGGAAPSGVTFQDAISSLAPDEPEEVTVPFYFICLLHLANEQSLALRPGDAASTNFSIVKDVAV